MLHGDTNVILLKRFPGWLSGSQARRWVCTGSRGGMAGPRSSWRSWGARSCRWWVMPHSGCQFNVNDMWMAWIAILSCIHLFLHPFIPQNKIEPNTFYIELRPWVAWLNRFGMDVIEYLKFMECYSTTDYIIIIELLSLCPFTFNVVILPK